MDMCPMFYRGQTVKNVETKEIKDVRAIYYSMEDDCFLYTFEFEDDKPSEYIKENVLEPVTKGERISDNSKEDDIGSIFRDAVYRYYDVLDLSPFRDFNLCHKELRKILLENYELLSDTIRLTNPEQREKSKYCEELDNFLSTWEDDFYLSQLLSVATVLPLYKVGYENGLWCYFDDLYKNDLWQEVTVNTIIINTKKVTRKDKNLEDSIFDSFKAYFHQFRRKYEQDGNYENCITWFVDITVTYLLCQSSKDIEKELWSKYNDMLIEHEIKIKSVLNLSSGLDKINNYLD